MLTLTRFAQKIPGVRGYIKQKNTERIDAFRKLEEQRKQADPKNLMNFENKVFSQFGEDGIIAEIFKRLGTTNKFFVEFGIEDGKESNCRCLLEQNGWQGLWIDGNPKKLKRAQNTFAKFPVDIRLEFITKENISEIFKAANVPTEFDLLSIDIDGNDYWVWQALKKYRPRVTIIEYNAAYLPEEDWVMPYNPKHRFREDAHFGASLRAYEKLGRELGYRLVGCSSEGVNAFFVREDLVTDKFTHVGDDVGYHYAAPKYKAFTFGWPRD